MLQVASVWFDFGEGERAGPILDEVRSLLRQGELIPVEQTSPQRVEYDLESTIKKILAVPELDPFLATRLREGR